MKTKKRNYGLFAVLTVVLLATTVLITSCSAPSGGPTKDEYSPGKGKVKLNIIDGTDLAANIARSINPNNPTFAEYDLTFTPYTDGTSDPGTVDSGRPGGNKTILRKSAATIGENIELEAGFWELNVVAYATTGAATGAAVGKTALPRIEVKVGVTTPTINVTVRPYDYLAGTGTGRFIYTVDLSAVTNPVPNSLTLPLVTALLK